MNVFRGFLTVEMAFKAVFNRTSMGEVVAHNRCGSSIFADFSHGSLPLLSFLSENCPKY